GLGTGACKAGILGEEAVARMDRLGAAAPGHVQHLGDVEIRFVRRSRTEMISLIGVAHMQRGAVHIREHRHRSDAHFAASPDDSHGDFAAVRDEDLCEHARVMILTTRPLSQEGPGKPKGCYRCGVGLGDVSRMMPPTFFLAASSIFFLRAAMALLTHSSAALSYSARAAGSSQDMSLALRRYNRFR